MLAVAAGLMVAAGLLTWRPLEVVPVGAFPFAAAGRAVSIEDGDSFVFERIDTAASLPRRFEVRLHAVDAPERIQRHGSASRAGLVELVSQRHLTLDCYKPDARGRAVCRASDLDRPAPQRDLELVLLSRGMVWHYRAYAGEQAPADRAAYAAAEAQARAARRGLWRDPEPQAPWECRARLRETRLCD